VSDDVISKIDKITSDLQSGAITVDKNTEAIDQ
jgi:hypothetical protein